MSMLRVIFLFAAFVYLVGCSSSEKNSDTPEGAYAIAQDYEKEERFDIAIQRYQNIRNKFLYSKYALMAELSIADCYFKQESFPEAQVAYQNFKDLHPKHAQIDYVTNQLALSYFNQLPSTSDRDLSLATNAIQYFEETYKNYPNSTYAKDAQEKKAATLKMLAEKEIYIADFYFKKQNYDSALTRYENSLVKYPGQGFDAKALSKATISAMRAGKKEKAQEHYNQLKAKFSDSEELKEATKEMK